MLLLAACKLLIADSLAHLLEMVLGSWMLRSWRGSFHVDVLEVRHFDGDVMLLRMKLPRRKFMFRPGQYLFINVPALSPTEWHPFTISSAPEESTFTCHIRCRKGMDWTHGLLMLLNPEKKPRLTFQSALDASAGAAAAQQPLVVKDNPLGRHNSSADVREGRDSQAGTWAQRQRAQQQNVGAAAADMAASADGGKKRRLSMEIEAEKAARKAAVAPVVRVDGPFGSPSEEVFGFSTIVLVGAGIGVTPFCSIMRAVQLQHRMRSKTATDGGADISPPPRVYFYWVCRSLEEFESFKGMLMDIVQQPDLKAWFTFNTFATGQIDLSKAQSHVVYGGYENYKQYTGRPNWDRELKSIASDHVGEHIGVFMCGPAPIAVQLRAACTRNSRRQKEHKVRTRFVFHKESF